MSTLQSIVYVSSSARLLSTADLDGLLTKSRARNLTHDITGLLLYCDGNFMQYIEGPAQQLAEVYALICGDRLHHGLIELVNEPIIRREFGAWSMAYAPAHMKDFESLLSASRRDGGEPGNRSDDSLGKQLLRSVWSRLTPAGY